MRLSVNRPRGGVLFFRGRGIIGSAIRWYTWSEVAHCAIFWEDHIVEAWHYGGVQCNPNPIWNRVDSDPTIEAFGVDCTEQQLIDAFIRASEWVNRPYDFMGILGFPLRANVEDRTKMFCSELVSEAFSQVGVPLLRCESYKISPGLLRISPRLYPFDWAN